MSGNLSQNEALIRKLTDIILSNLRDQDFGVEKLAKEAGMSRFTLNRKLRAARNQDVSQFIRSVRLQKAMEMLKNSEGTISEIAFSVGFGSPAYFTKCFHDYYGYPPGKTREQPFGTHFEPPGARNSAKLRRFLADRRQVVIISVVITATAIFLLLLINSFNNRSSIYNAVTDAGSRNSIAVLPIRNLGASTEDLFLYEGIMEEVYYSLSKIHNMDVISFRSLQQYRDSKLTPEELRSQLDVDFIVEGSGQKSGDSFCLWVHLIDASNGVQLWSEPFRGKMSSTKRLFRTQSRIAQEIASVLETRVSLKERELIESIPTTSLGAYNNHFLGNRSHLEYLKTNDSALYNTAVAKYLAAIAGDPGFARAYASLAQIYLKRNMWKGYFSENYLDSADALLEMALSIDKSFDEALFLKGEVCRLKGKSDLAIAYYDNALSVNPSHINSIINKWYLQNWVKDDYVDALRNCYRALALIRGEDRASIYSAAARTYIDAGFPEIARDYYRKAYMLDSNRITYIVNTSWIEWCTGDFEKALKTRYELEKIDTTIPHISYYCVIRDRHEEAFRQALRLIERHKKGSGPMLQGSHRVGFAFWQVGKKDEALQFFRQQIEYSEKSIALGRDIEQRKAAHYDLAGTYAFLGNKEKAYYYLDELAKKRAFPIWWITIIKNDLLFESIRHEERFRKIVEKMESKYMDEHSRVKKWIDSQPPGKI
ncbi:MAG: helix-turn-helix domain-containing protein [Bacteroidales bacterium]|nr:helix-turn-helix domain-containing protein [Bacteroidales bacterium]